MKYNVLVKGLETTCIRQDRGTATSPPFHALIKLVTSHFLINLFIEFNNLINDHSNVLLN